jgi:hypothetical protein
MIGGMTHIDTLDPKEGATKGPGQTDQDQGGLPARRHDGKSRQAGRQDQHHPQHELQDRRACQRPVSDPHVATSSAAPSSIPNIGAWAQHFKGPSHKTLPSSVCVNRQPQNGNGFFPASFSPLPILDPDAGLQYSQQRRRCRCDAKRIAMLNKLDAGFRERSKPPA